MCRKDTPQNRVVIYATEAGIGISSIITVNPEIAALLANGHAKDKIAKLQKKTKLTITHKLTPAEGEKKDFDSSLAVISQKPLNLPELANTTNVVREMHELVLCQTILPTILEHMLADLKPLEDNEQPA